MRVLLQPSPTPSLAEVKVNNFTTSVPLVGGMGVAKGPQALFLLLTLPPELC